MRIILVRHGPPAPVAASRLLDSTAFARWCAEYAQVGLSATAAAPSDLVALARAGARVVSSDLPRAMASAALLAPDIHVITSPLLREAEVPVPPWHRVRLPLTAWLALSRAGWLAGLWQGAESRAAVAARAGAAAEWLSGLAMRDGGIIAVTHGAVRPAIARALLASGWRGRGWGRYAPWSAWAFTAPSGARGRS